MWFGILTETSLCILHRHYPVDMEDLQQHFHAVFMEDFRRQLEAESAPSYVKTTTYVCTRASCASCSH